MSFFNSMLQITQKGLVALGGFYVIWGLVVLAGGFKDKTAPEVKQGMGQMIAGAMILLAAAFVTQISL